MSITNSKQVKSCLVLNIRRKNKAILVDLIGIIRLLPNSSSESKFLNYISSLFLIGKWNSLVRFWQLFSIRCCARSFRVWISLFCIWIHNRINFDQFVFWVHSRLDLSLTFINKFVFTFYQINSLLSIQIFLRWILRSRRVCLASHVFWILTNLYQIFCIVRPLYFSSVGNSDHCLESSFLCLTRAEIEVRIGLNLYSEIQNKIVFIPFAL